MSWSTTAIVVLGCRVVRSPSLQGALGRRVAQAAAAYHAQIGQFVVVSGGKPWDGVREADAMREQLITEGVPGDNILTESLSWSTLENALFTSALLARRGLSQVALVTCDFHISRASRLFRAQGLGVEEIPVATPKPHHSPTVQRAVEAAKGWLNELQLRFQA